MTFQQQFAQSDDAAAVLAGGRGSSLRVDASDASLAALLELVMLRRGTDNVFIVADSTRRGRLLRRLLKSPEPFLSDGACGMLELSALGGVTVDAATNDFADAFRVQLVQAGLVATAAQRLSAALHELLTNIDEHAGDGAGGLGAFEIAGREAWMVVADSGRGVLGGYRASPLETKPASVEEALRWAVIEHRSRTGDPQRGLGFQSVVQSVRSLDGCLRVRSDTASLELEQKADRSSFLVREQGQLPGFVVSALLHW
jgi:hypothetical protein